MSGRAWLLCLGACAGCLSAPPDSSDEPGDPDSAVGQPVCVSYGFADLADFYQTEETGCRIEVDGRVHFVQEASMAIEDGCYVEPMRRFDAHSATVTYAGETDVSMTLLAHGVEGKVAITRYGGVFQATAQDPGGGAIGQKNVTFEADWTVWRIAWDPAATTVSAGPSAEEMAPVLTLDPLLSGSGIGVMLGSWPGELDGGERAASFDDLEICP